MQVVIEISDDLYYAIQKERYGTYSLDASELYRIVQRESTVLPKGHGRLIDADDLSFFDIQSVNGLTYNCVTSGDVSFAPTVLEADKDVEK